MVYQEAESKPGSPRQIRKEKSQARAEVRAVNNAVQQAVLPYYGILGGISVSNEVEGVEIERDEARGTKEVRLHLTRSEVALAPEGILKVLADLGIGRKDNPFVAVRLSEKLETVSQLNDFCFVLLPHKATDKRFGIELGLWHADVLASNMVQVEVNPDYSQIAQKYSKLWQPNASTFRRPNHHPAKAEILGAGYEWIGQVVAGRIQLVESGFVRPAEIAK